MKFFIVIVMLFVASCTVVNNGMECNLENQENCENYIPLYTPLKIFVISALK